MGEAPDEAGLVVAGRLTRFLNLERARKPASEAPHEVVTPHRFEQEPEVRLAPDHGERPFTRCPGCEADNGRFATACVNCRGRLDTEEAQAFNDRLWARRILQDRRGQPPRAAVPPDPSLWQALLSLLRRR